MPADVYRKRTMGRFKEALRRQYCSILFGRSNHPTKGAKELEAPFDRIDSYLTPTELFYIRSHFPTPTWTAPLSTTLDGAVRRPFALSYEELRSMRSETRVATLECAGNSRVFLVPQVQGAQWELGAVGNAEWTGVPLRALLERADLPEDACEIVLEGADHGTPKEEPVPPGPISYALEPAPSQGNSAGSPDRLRDEWSRSFAGSRISAPRNCAWSLWNGFRQVADEYPAVREPFHGYWQTRIMPTGLRWTESPCGGRWEK